MIFCHLKIQHLTTLLMLQGGPLLYDFFFPKKNNNKSNNYHVDKDGHELYLRVAMYHISKAKTNDFSNFAKHDGSG
jgi:hypothetical protein